MVVAIVSIVLLALAVSLDGFWGGFAYGLRKIKIPIFSLALISFWSIVGTMITMIVGNSIVTYLSVNAAKWIGAILLISIGIYALREGLEQNNKLSKEKLNNNEDSDIDNKAKTGYSCKEDNLQLTFRENEGTVDQKINPIVLLFKVLKDPLEADMDKSGTISMVEGTILGLAVAMDACIAAFALAIAGINPFITPFLFGLTHFILIGLGNIIASHNKVNKIGSKLAFIPGGILIIIGLLRVL